MSDQLYRAVYEPMEPSPEGAIQFNVGYMVPVTDQQILYRMICDSVTHEEEGTQLEDGEVKDDAAEPIDGRCLDWHPQLVRYVEVGKGDN